jgi:FixJ family two-component response regulator
MGQQRESGTTMDGTEDLFLHQPATARRPLLGLTVLVVEDSRFASEAIRLLCLRSGARIRRADSLSHAERHLRIYRPCVMIVDVGLPDGSGLKLIHDMAQAVPRIDVILGTSGDDMLETDVIASGADGFLAKPVLSLSAFQDAILSHLPQDRQPPGPRLLSDEEVQPDMIAFHDDLSHVAQVLDGGQELAAIDYVTQFLGGVARSVSDPDLGEAVDELALRRSKGEPLKPQIAQLAALVQARLASAEFM